MEYILSAYVNEKKSKPVLYSKYRIMNWTYKPVILYEEQNSWIRKSITLSKEEGEFVISNWDNKIYKNFILKLFTNQSIDNVKCVQIEIYSSMPQYIKTN
jgi:hypothetical protein